MAKYVYIHCDECGRNRSNYAKGLCLQCYWRRYREAHGKQLAENSRRWYRANSEKAKEWASRWRKSNLKRDCERVQRRRARKKGATIKPVDEAAIYERDGHMCMYCGTTRRKLTIDHVVPLASGGSHREDNLVVACGSCNSSKHTSPLKDWLRTRPYSLAWLF